MATGIGELGIGDGGLLWEGESVGGGLSSLSDSRSVMLPASSLSLSLRVYIYEGP